MHGPSMRSCNFHVLPRQFQWPSSHVLAVKMIYSDSPEHNESMHSTSDIHDICKEEPGSARSNLPLCLPGSPGVSKMVALRDLSLLAPASNDPHNSLGLRYGVTARTPTAYILRELYSKHRLSLIMLELVHHFLSTKSRRTTTAQLPKPDHIFRDDAQYARPFKPTSQAWIKGSQMFRNPSALSSAPAQRRDGLPGVRPRVVLGPLKRILPLDSC